jgi:DNA polymerase phi
LERRDPTTNAEDDDVEVEADDDEEEEEEGEGDDDKKMEDGERDSEKSSSSNQNEDEGSSHETTDDELRKKIKVALKNNGVEAASETDPSSGSEGELMDDDQMLAMDHKLAAVFKAKAGEKKSGKGLFV